MTPSRRGKRSFAGSNPDDASTGQSETETLKSVSYQEVPLQCIVDVFKQQRRASRDDVEAHVWLKRRGGRKSRLKMMCMGQSTEEINSQ